jgi:exodeoxyribonuclease V beta subunit
VSRPPLDPRTIPLSGTQVIEASAGTGKTHTITSLLLRLVTEGRLGIEQILAVTFTNAAAAELEERIQKRLVSVQAAVLADRGNDDELARHLLESPDREEMLRRLETAARNVDRAAVTTIHGFCARVLSEYALSAGTRPDTTLLGDDRGVLYDVVTDFWSTRVARLSAEEFRLLRGEGLHADLAKVAKGVVSAPGVPLDRDESAAFLGDQLARYRADFEHMRAAFAERGSSLLETLRSARGMNQTSYKPAIIEREYGKLDGFFRGAELNPGAYPDLEAGRFTTERVDRSAKKGQVAPKHPLLDALEAHRELSREVVALAAQQRDALLRDLAREIEDRLVLEHTRLRTQSFDGLLRALAKSLGDPVTGPGLGAAIRRRYPALLIDEFQDTDPVQYSVFRQIYGADRGGAERGAAAGAALFFIGDPKQSIYRFRGADVSTYLQAAGGGAGEVWTLGTNWRSGPAVVAAQNALFGLHQRPFGNSTIQYEPVRPAPGRTDELRSAAGRVLPGLRLVRAGAADTIGLAATEVSRLLSAGHELGGRPVSARDVAVLTRTNKQAQDVQAALRQLGVPAIMHGDRSVFEAPEALELRRVLRALLEPGRRTLLHAALATRLFGRTASELARLETDADVFEREMASVRRYGAAWRHRGIAVALETVFSEVDLLARTLEDVDGERRMTNLRHLLELLHQAEVERHLGMVGLLRFLETAIAAPTGHEMAAEARQVRLESDDDAVTLTTVHKSKGLEYGIVVLPQIGKEDRPFPSPIARYHDPKRSLREFLHVGEDDEIEELARLEEHDEALRVGYVGITRARHQVIAYMGTDDVFSALGWFLHGGRVSGELARKEAMKQLSEASIEESYRALEQRAAGAVEVELAPADVLDLPAYQRRAAPALSLTPPIEVSPPLTHRRTSSFSAMTRTKAPLSRAEREGKDVDRAGDPGRAALTSEAAAATLPEGIAADGIALDGFPRGAGPGDALHAMLERFPFLGGSPDARQDIVQAELGRRGFDGVHAPNLGRCLAAALEVPLTPSGTCLGDLDVLDCARELEFSLPVCGQTQDGTSALRLLSAKAMGRALEPHASESLDHGAQDFLLRSYIEQVKELDFAEFEGFLRGFLDLVFYKGGQFFVLDYKSNHLGSRYADYERPKLQTVMESHHYLLQALLYSVATHRYARARLPGYRYSAHFGGVSYLFLRGVDPEQPLSKRGVYFFRPSERLIEDLSRALAGEGAA